MTAPHCPVCQRWNDPTGGADAHSGGCLNAGQPYPAPLLPPVRALEVIREILWPLADPDEQWTAGTIEEVAEIIERAGYGPRPKG